MVRVTKIGKYALLFDPNLEHQAYTSGANYGIKFIQGNYIYDVTCHEHLGERLVITHKETSIGYCRDIPLHGGSAWLLPNSVSLCWPPVSDGSPTLDEQVPASSGDGETFEA